MSATSRWVYKNTATVKPFVGENGMTGAIDFGAEYEIACTWTAEAKVMTNANGEEFLSTYQIFTEDARPHHKDMILINSAGAEWQEIQLRIDFDMSFFSETPDYKLVT